MMLTFRAGKLAARAVFCACLSIGAALSLGACSREQQDWRAAEAADTVEGYGQFLNQHPDSELVTAARTRVAQLTEEHEWQQAGSADTADAYRKFLAQHPNGKWAQEARIRLQNFSLSSLSPEGAPDAGPTRAVAPPPERAATGNAASAPTPAPARSTAATPGELAEPTPPAPTARLSTAYVSTPRTAGTTAGGTNQPAVNLTQPAAPIAGAPVGYGVQLGAFTSETAANAAWQQLTSHFGPQLSGLAPLVLAANTASGTLYRLQARVPDEARARALCDMLRKESQACVPVLPH